jgi:hypothetical protein
MIHQLPSRTCRAISATCFAGTRRIERSSSPTIAGRSRMICVRSLETFPARARSTSGSSPSSLAMRRIVSSPGGGCSPRSILTQCLHFPTKALGCFAAALASSEYAQFAVCEVIIERAGQQKFKNLVWRRRQSRRFMVISSITHNRNTPSTFKITHFGGKEKVEANGGFCARGWRSDLGRYQRAPTIPAQS